MDAGGELFCHEFGVCPRSDHSNCWLGSYEIFSKPCRRPAGTDSQGEGDLVFSEPPSRGEQPCSSPTGQ